MEKQHGNASIRTQNSHQKHVNRCCTRFVASERTNSMNKPTDRRSTERRKQKQTQKCHDFERSAGLNVAQFAGECGNFCANTEREPFTDEEVKPAKRTKISFKSLADHILLLKF